jgi:hypothetical protein
MTFVEALWLAGSIPDDAVRDLAVAAIDVRLAEIAAEEAAEDRAAAEARLWLLQVQHGVGG